MKYEYMLHWWGGCEKFIIDKYGYDKYLYFNTKEERDLVKRQLFKDGNELGLAMTEAEGYLTHKDTIAIITLRYEDIEYVYEYNFGKEYPEDAARFQFEKGNRSCDCNKSLHIGRYCDKNFPEMGCGDNIELIKLDIVYR